MIQYNVNLLAVLLAAIASMIIGTLWYSPILFGKIWMKEMGMTEKNIEEAKAKGGMWKYYLGNFIASLITLFIFTIFVTELSSKTISSAIGLAILVWLGFFATVMLGSVIWEGKSLKMYLINIFYHLVNLIVAAVIISLFF